MKTRVLTGIIAFLVLIPFIVFSDTVVFPIGVAICAVIAVWEALHCVGLHKNFWLLIPYGLVALATPVSVRYWGVDETLTVAVAVIFLLMLYTYAVCVFARGKINVADACGGLVSSLYAIGGFAALVFLHDFHMGGRFLYLLAFIGAWITDIFAYFSGRLFGKHKLIPEISPKKTIEGSIGGILFCTASFVLFGVIVGAQLGSTPNYLVLGALGFLVSVLSQIGDLFASLIKREHDVKDYGKIFPGHGGVMDRFDSVIATAPLLLIVCTLDSILSLNLLL